MKVTRKITICGLVQGIGFRPFVHQVAHRFHLNGEVNNNENGVQILVTGPSEVIDAFYHELLHYPYQLARIKRSRMDSVTLRSFPDFRIVPSEKGKRVNLPFTPDMALCEHCTKELEDHEDRRFGYPFTACVECGQRWSISKAYPFEREHTSYRDRSLCPSCETEYTHLDDRRYHAQTISCAECGFSCWLEEGGKRISGKNVDVFEAAAKLLKQGKILAVKNSAGFLLCCDATSTPAINELRKRKHRPDKPLAVLFKDLEEVRAVVHCNTEEAEELQGRVSPIVIMPLRQNPDILLATDALAPGLDQLGVMLPYNGILRLLANAFGGAMVATSGNMHTKPVIADNQTALEELAEVADVFLLHDQEIANAQDDSVVKFTPEHKQRIVMRRSRGMAPNYFDAPMTSEKQLLAMGGELKSAIGLIPNQYLYISQYLGALGALETYDRYREVLDRFWELFDLKPELVITDKHPGYQSTLAGTALAKEQSIPLRQVQHHEAHFAAILGEHHLLDHRETVLGVIWDGTGYGDDGNVWGGEFFTYKDHYIHRLAHMGYFSWLAGDKMAREPRLSLLAAADSEQLLEAIKHKFSTAEWQVYTQLKKNNRLLTSSVGRLFDAASSLLGLCDSNTFEGQAAMLLEACAAKGPREGVEGWDVFDASGELQPSRLFEVMHKAKKGGAAREVLALGFLKTLVTFIFKVADRSGAKIIALSGGVFQNALLTDLILTEAQGRYRICLHRELSPNDENIAFGQLMHALHIKENT
ncbi:carbamoyltransferase HypF [Robertkochia sediminum]|uniref:carbamoyltransferase HypF n=1 Tax=Robertkochia sediminum TaxID=2785326 RepID=UPI001932FF70|nr:carbamoyltransferase HypF [Robertkochia sediminum]MBL7472313.1 carbamoyltransferase HypF [Robertkochia sediminum]